MKLIGKKLKEVEAMRSCFFENKNIFSSDPVGEKCPKCGTGNMFFVKRFVFGVGLIKQEACDNSECSFCKNEDNACLRPLEDVVAQRSCH
jgi:hypothetical protein